MCIVFILTFFVWVPVWTSVCIATQAGSLVGFILSLFNPCFPFVFVFPSLLDLQCIPIAITLHAASSHCFRITAEFSDFVLYAEVQCFKGSHIAATHGAAARYR